MADIPNLASAITGVTEALSTKDNALTSEARTELANACTGLLTTLELPPEKVFRMMMAVSLPFPTSQCPEIDGFANSLIPLPALG